MGATHALAVALDEFLTLSSPAFAERRLIEEYYREHRLDGLPPAVAALARLRWEAEREVERLIALLDAIDGDPDLEPSLTKGGYFAGEVVDGEIDAGEEAEDVCEDEGACDEREQDHRSEDERERIRRRRSAAKRFSDALGIPILRHASL